MVYRYAEIQAMKRCHHGSPVSAIHGLGAVSEGQSRESETAEALLNLYSINFKIEFVSDP